MAFLSPQRMGLIGSGVSGIHGLIFVRRVDWLLLMNITFHADMTVTSEGDRLQFARFVKPLATVLRAETTTTPLTVGVFGPWGSGKSSLLRLLQEELEKNDPERFLFIPFNPWTHRREPNMLVPLLHAAYDATTKKSDAFKESAQKIFNVLTRLGADLLLKAVTVDAVDLEKLEELEESYVKSRQKVESEMRKLRQTLEEWAQEVYKSTQKGRRIVFVIDDLDRCEPTEILDVLEAVKLFLDVPHMMVILAVDKEVIDRGIEVRYDKFPFAKERKAALGAEYLEKIVQLPVVLPPLGGAEIDGLLDALKVKEVMPEVAPLLGKLVPPNPRKIKRIVNLLAFTNAILEETPSLKGSIDKKLAARLAVLQVQMAPLYEEIARRPALLKALQKYATTRLNLQQMAWDEFGTNKDSFKTICETHFALSGGFLDRIFDGQPFKSIEGNPALISRYINLTTPRPE